MPANTVLPKYESLVQLTRLDRKLWGVGGASRYNPSSGGNVKSSLVIVARWLIRAHMVASIMMTKIFLSCCCEGLDTSPYPHKDMGYLPTSKG